nr:SxtJ family membrane protein [Prochlorococcus marinus]
MQETISKKQLRDFGLLIGFGFPILIGWLLPSLFGHEFRTWTFWVGILGLILGLTAPRLLLYPYKSWIALGNILGWVNSHIILGLVFILILQPIAYIMRLTGYDPLRTRRKGEKTYRETRKKHQTDLTRIF